MDDSYILKHSNFLMLTFDQCCFACRLYSALFIVSTCIACDFLNGFVHEITSSLMDVIVFIQVKCVKLNASILTVIHPRSLLSAWQSVTWLGYAP